MGNYNLFSRNTQSTDDRTCDPLASPLTESTSSTTCTNDVSEESSLSSELFQQFYSKLVETLPMDDAVFVAKLFSNDLLPGDLKNQLRLVHRTSADKAVLFLDSVIEPSVTSDGGSSFDKLLHVMEDSEYQHVKELAEEIRSSLRKRSSSNNGNYLRNLPCIWLGPM